MIKELKVIKIDNVINETDDVKTFLFNHKIDFAPGQFIMVWIPRVDEKPFTVSYHDSNRFGITVFKLGEFTNKLFLMDVGDSVGVRGPYGNGFVLGNDKTCAIGGGVGMASIATLAEKLNNLVMVQGAKTSTALLYQKRFPDMLLCTDDGSKGFSGYPTDYLSELSEKHKFKKIYTCGPEIMMKKVFGFCQTNGISCEASLERYMKCGIGVCGQCVCDGHRVCTDGPVFSGKTLAGMIDFGKYSLQKSGKRVGIDK